MPEAPSIKEALEPCPFCGAAAHIQGACDDRMFFVVCLGSECYCAVGEGYDRDAMPEHAFSSHEEAALAWNTRATLQPSGERREAIARIIYMNRRSVSERDAIEHFAAYKENPIGYDNARIAIFLALKDADALIASGLVQNEAGIRADERYKCSKVAENPGFIEAQDTEWDLGVNFAKKFIAAAIRSARDGGAET